MSRSGGTNWGVLLILLLIGFIFGTIMGEILRPHLPFLAVGSSASMEPQTFRLADAFSLTFGFKANLNLATIIGVALAYIIYRQL
ncbi:MAG: DUF4321 domain-containing protein [Bacillota bacterium]